MAGTAALCGLLGEGSVVSVSAFASKPKRSRTARLWELYCYFPLRNRVFIQAPTCLCHVGRSLRVASRRDRRSRSGPAHVWWFRVTEVGGAGQLSAAAARQAYSVATRSSCRRHCRVSRPAACPRAPSPPAGPAARAFPWPLPTPASAGLRVPSHTRIPSHVVSAHACQKRFIW